MKRLWNWLTPRKPAPLAFSPDLPAQHQKTARCTTPPQDKYEAFTPAGIERDIANQLRYQLTALREISPKLAVTVLSDVIEWLVAEGHWSANDARIVLQLSALAIPKSYIPRESQAHSLARAKCARWPRMDVSPGKKADRRAAGWPRT